MKNNINNKTGWECPNCKRVYAPWMPSCTSCQPKILSSSTSGNSWIGGISSVAQPIPEKYVVRGQSQPTEYHSDLSKQLLNETTPEELNKIDSEMEEMAKEEIKTPKHPSSSVMFLYEKCLQAFHDYKNNKCSDKQFEFFLLSSRNESLTQHKEEICKSHFEGANRLSQGKNVIGEDYYNKTFKYKS